MFCANCTLCEAKRHAFAADLAVRSLHGPVHCDRSARKAIDTLLSKDSQIALLKAAFRRPTRSDIAVSEHVGLPEMSTIKVFAVDENEAAIARDAFLAEWAALPKAGDVK